MSLGAGLNMDWLKSDTQSSFFKHFYNRHVKKRGRKSEYKPQPHFSENKGWMRTAKRSTHDEKLTFEKSCGRCSRLETTKDSKLYVQPPNLAYKDAKLASLSSQKVAPFRLKSNVRTKVWSRRRSPSCGVAPEARPVCSGAERGCTWLSSGAQQDEWSSGWTWVQGPLGVGSGWSGVSGIVQRPLITSGAGEVGLWCLHVLFDDSSFLLLPTKKVGFQIT